MLKRIINFAHHHAPGSYLLLMYMSWLLPILLIAFLLTSIYVISDGMKYLSANHVFIIHLTAPITIILIMSGIFAIGLNLVEHEMKFWKRLGAIGRFITIFGAYSICSSLAFLLIDTYDGSFGGKGLDDANMAVLLFPSTCIFFIIGFLFTCLRFFGILRSRNF